MVKVRTDLTGQKFGRLIVIKQIEDYVASSGRHYPQWLCECSCEEHNQIKVTGANLKSGNVTSCGCYKKEKMSMQAKKYNNYQLNLIDKHGVYGVGICNNTNAQFYFDMDDYDKIKNYCWYEIIDNDGYHRLLAYINILNTYKTMAQIIAGKYFDHKDRNPLNNRKYNLRKANASDNARNKSKQHNNTSEVSGVGWHKASNAWCARVTVNNKPIWLGTFINKEDAIKARLNAEKQYYGEFAPQSHLFEQYGITKGDE